MIQAAAVGAVDFAAADPRSPAWIRKVQLICDQLEATRAIEFYRMLHFTTLASLGRSDLTEQSYDKLRDRAADQIKKVQRYYFPWENVEADSEKKRAIVRLGEMWKSIWGDPNSPETQAAIQRTVASMKSEKKPVKE